jgi:integrase
LRVADVDESQAGLRVIVRHSKTDQEGEGATVAIARGAVVCPVKALQEWLEAAGISSGPVFRAVSKSGAVAEAGLSDRSVANIVKAMVGAVGLDATAFSGHSLRSGFLTSAATAARTFSR